MKLIFLTGHRKSGTTLLHSLFDGHGNFNVIPCDLTVLYDYFPVQMYLEEDQLWPRLEAVVRKAAAGVILGNSDFLNNHAPVNELVQIVKRETASIDLRNKELVFGAVIRSWSDYMGFTKDLPVVVKETSQSIYFHEFIEWYPTSLFINIIRDPRDNYASIKSGINSYYASFGEDDLKPIASVINRARMDLISARVNNETYPDSYRAVRFEDLTTDPEETMRGLCAFCGVGFSDNMLRPTKSGGVFTGNNYDAVKFSGVSAQNVGKWPDRITAEEAEIIEFWLHDVMEQWGYELSTSLTASSAAFSKFYDWYNSTYFYHDSLAGKRVQN